MENGRKYPMFLSILDYEKLKYDTYIRSGIQYLDSSNELNIILYDNLFKSSTQIRRKNFFSKHFSDLSIHKQGHTVHKTAKEKLQSLINYKKTNKKQEEIQKQLYHTTKPTFEAKKY